MKPKVLCINFIECQRAQLQTQLYALVYEVNWKTFECVLNITNIN